MRYNLSLVTAPVVEPITLEEVKGALRIDESSDDDLIAVMITAARTAAEDYTRRAFITQTYKMYLDNLPRGNKEAWWDGVRQLPVTEISGQTSLELPKPPLISVTHLKSYSDTDVATTFSTGSYYVSTYAGDFAANGAITLRVGAAWPAFVRLKDGIEIQFVCGYGANRFDVPQQIRMALIQEACFLYENRGSCDMGSIQSPVAKRLLDSFRIRKL